VSKIIRNFAMSKSKTMDKAVKKEMKRDVGQWLMDIAKYIITAAIITGFLGDITQKWLYYTAGLFAASTCFFGGLYLSYKK
jgi:bacteriorhodopsin